MITARDRFPNANPVEWADATGSYRALELPDGKRVAVECLSRILSPEESAAAAAAEGERKSDADRRAVLREIRARIRSGTETAADRSRAIKILIGLVLSDKPEAGE